MRLTIDFEKSEEKSSRRKQSASKPIITTTLATPLLTSVMVAGIVVPQFSLFLKGIFSTQINQPVMVSAETKFRLPVVSGVPVTSEYGWRTHPITGNRQFHAGIDFGAAYGQPIYAAAGGKVSFSGEKGGYGNAVIIDHNNRESTLYGHASELLVRAGQQVVQGQLIAKVGSTGFSTGPHLHFEVRINGKHTNPRPFLKQLGK